MLDNIFSMDISGSNTTISHSRANTKRKLRRARRRPPVSAQQIYDEQRDSWLKAVQFFIMFK